jgi:hypothetical protein
MLIRYSTTSLGLAAVLLSLAACGGSGGSAAPAPTAAEPAAAPAPARAASDTLSGTVAVGAPITGGTLRVVDADGTVVADAKTIGSDGRYDGVSLTGRAPWRLEACGYAAERWVCLRSIVQAAGTGHVTPLTDAMLELGTTDASSMATQPLLRSGLATLLADAGLASDFDFVSGALEAGSRSGYDRLLDAIGVVKGRDGRPFVQIVPRLGQGNLYIEQGGSPEGTMSVDNAARSLPLAGLERLFRDMTAALAGAKACASQETGIRRTLSAQARLGSDDGTPAVGADAVAQRMCAFFGAGDDGRSPMWGSTLMSPTLGRCDFTGAAPRCRVGFAIRSAEGEVRSIGNGMGVSYEAGAWRFLGDLSPLSIHASANVQRDRRVDGTEPVDLYMRALSFEVPAVPGLACAKVSQRNAAGVDVLVAYYKRHGSGTPRRLSLWTTGSGGNDRSLDVAIGATRSDDDTWIGLPEGTVGDTVIRNFYRGGRVVQVDLYGDAACTTGFSVDGRSRFEVEVDGVPPLWSALPSLPWPSLTDASVAALRALTLPADGTGSLAAAWTAPRGGVGFSEVSVCRERACGEGSDARIGSSGVRPTASTVTMSLRSAGAAVPANGFRMLSLYGRNAEGLGVQANMLSCPSRPAGQRCE